MARELGRYYVLSLKPRCVLTQRVWESRLLVITSASMIQRA